MISVRDGRDVGASKPFATAMLEKRWDFAWMNGESHLTFDLLLYVYTVVL